MFGPQTQRMSSDTTPVWGAPQPGPKWTRRHTLAAVGIAAVIAAFGGAAIYAATGGNSNATGPGFGPGPGGYDRQRGLSAMDPADAVHGEFVISQNGGYTTELIQTGVLTSVSETSIEAKSEDGFTQTYRLSPDSRANSGLAIDDTVTIRATKANGAVTATMVTESDDGPPTPPR
jgi:hypothetical protein